MCISFPNQNFSEDPSSRFKIQEKKKKKKRKTGGKNSGKPIPKID